jgi:hypothetical protein
MCCQSCDNWCQEWDRWIPELGGLECLLIEMGAEINAKQNMKAAISASQEKMGAAISAI